MTEEEHVQDQGSADRVPVRADGGRVRGVGCARSREAVAAAQGSVICSHEDHERSVSGHRLVTVTAALDAQVSGQEGGAPARAVVECGEPK